MYDCPGAQAGRGEQGLDNPRDNTRPSHVHEARKWEYFLLFPVIGREGIFCPEPDR